LPGQLRESGKDRGPQCLGQGRVFGAAVKVPDMSFAQWAKRTLLGIEVKHELVFGMSVNHAYRSVSQGPEDASPL